jgi:hypothetical protein
MAKHWLSQRRPARVAAQVAVWSRMQIRPKLYSVVRRSRTVRSSSVSATAVLSLSDQDQTIGLPMHHTPILVAKF